MNDIAYLIHNREPSTWRLLDHRNEPASPDQMTAKFGSDLKPAVTKWLRAFVNEREDIGRAGMLNRMTEVHQAAGMQSPAKPAFTLIARYDPIGYGATRTPKVCDGPITVQVQWFPDGAIVLQSEHLHEDRETIISLYMEGGCRHEYDHRSEGYRGTWHRSVCRKCQFSYVIDSGD
jgi:hypothetical protein